MNPMSMMTRKQANRLIKEIKSKKPDYLTVMEECKAIGAEFSAKDLTLTITFGWEIDQINTDKKSKKKV